MCACCANEVHVCVHAADYPLAVSFETIAAWIYEGVDLVMRKGWKSIVALRTWVVQDR